MSDNVSIPRLTVLCLLMVCLLWSLSGCSQNLPWIGESVPQKLYIDGTRNFAVEFPGDWERLEDPDSEILRRIDGVIWEKPAAGHDSEPARMAVLIPAEKIDHKDMEEQILRFLPELEIQSRNEQEIAETRGTEILGATPLRTYHVFLIGDTNVRYLLTYSAPSLQFEEHRRAFRDMVRSFDILR